MDLRGTILRVTDVRGCGDWAVRNAWRAGAGGFELAEHEAQPARGCDTVPVWLWPPPPTSRPPPLCKLRYVDARHASEQGRVLHWGVTRAIRLHQLDFVTAVSLRNCYRLEVLPAEIGYMPNLNRLDCSNCSALSRVPPTLCQRALSLRFVDFTGTNLPKDFRRCVWSAENHQDYFDDFLRALCAAFSAEPMAVAYALLAVGRRRHFRRRGLQPLLRACVRAVLDSANDPCWWAATEDGARRRRMHALLPAEPTRKSKIKLA